jgi:uroporphyrinogen decarboxylase
MTSKERVLAAVNHRATERIPITFDAEKEVYAALHDRLGTRSKEELFDRLNVDTWMIGPRTPEAQAEKGGTIWGYRTKVTAYSGGTYNELVYSPLAGKNELSDIRNHPWPGPDALTFSHCPAEAAAHADRAVIGTFTWGAYFIATFVRGMEDLMTDFAIRRKYADCLIRTVAERTLMFVDRLLESAGDGIDIVYMADDYCSQLAPMFSPGLFRQLVVPYLRATADRVHARDKKLLLHVCGAVRPLLPMILDAGVDMLEPIQTRAAGMDPAELKREFGRRLCFYGGVDLQQTLVRGTPQGVADEVSRLIDILGEGGGYIIGPGHTYIQVDSPLENILAMYETAAGYRRRDQGNSASGLDGALRL